MHATFYLRRTGLSFHFKLFFFFFYSFNKYEDLSYKPSDIEFLTPTLSGNVFQKLIFTTPGGCFLLLVYIYIPEKKNIKRSTLTAGALECTSAEG